MSGRIRLDLALEQRGLLPSRARARDAVKRGTVTVNGVLASKPHQMVAESDVIGLDDPAARYVSRAALKLIAGLDAADIDVMRAVCLDVGASTGGFTQVLLERGAAKVFAVDVGQGQLHERLRRDRRVVCLEETNARDLSAAIVPDAIDLLVSDVSFVSVTKVLAAPLALCRRGAMAVVLFKPQFEVGQDNIGRGGIVNSAEAVETALADMIAFMVGECWETIAQVPSPIAGGDGNQEIVTVFRKI